MRATLTYLMQQNSRLTHLAQYPFGDNEIMWVPPVGSSVTLEFVKDLKRQTDDFTVVKICTEYDTDYSSTSKDGKKCTISVIVRQDSLYSMGENDE